jgi:hypothetical protein
MEIKTIDSQYGWNYEGTQTYLFENKHYYKGCYAISPEIINSDREKILMKVGLGGLSRSLNNPLSRSQQGDLFRRISSYHTCFPSGLNIISILFLRKTAIDKGAEWCNAFLRRLETELFAAIDKYRFKPNYRTRLKPHEWFSLSVQQARKAMRLVHEAHPKLTFLLFPSQKESKKDPKPINGRIALGWKEK